MKEMKEGNHMSSNIENEFRENVKLAQVLWGKPSKIALHGLLALIARYSVSVAGYLALGYVVADAQSI
jgi:hypothetical protein